VRSDRLLIVTALLFVAGCPANDVSKGLEPATPDTTLDYNDFVCSAQPVLIKRCSYLGCHGNPSHALRVFSAGKLRYGDVATREQRDAPLTAQEVQLNFDSAVGLTLSANPVQRAQPDVQAIPLLLKPLAARFGGSEHHGVAVFPTSPHQNLADDPEWNALANWVAGAKQPKPPVQTCQDLFMLLGLQPK
jgi:hypothetical protein